MSTFTNVFNLYELPERKYLLINMLRPGYSNALYETEIIAETILVDKVNMALEQYSQEKNIDKNLIKLIGTCEQEPEETVFYENLGAEELEIHVSFNNKYGSPWIVFGIAENEEQFFCNINKNSDNAFSMAGIGPKPPAKKIVVNYKTQNDFDLSMIKGYNSKNVEP